MTAGRHASNDSPTIRSIEMPTHPHGGQRRKRDTAFAAVIVGTVALCAGWSILAGRSVPLAAREPENDSSAAKVANAREFVVKHPFDTAGWLAWAGASGVTTTPQNVEADAAIAAAATIAPRDPQVLRARAIRLAAQGNHEAALRTLSLAARAGDGSERDSAMASMFPLIGTPAFAAFIGKELKARGDFVDQLLLRACDRGIDLARLAQFAQMVVRDHAVDDDIVNCVAGLALAQNQAAFAHWFWLNGSRRLPQTIAHVFNGNFDQQPGAGVFDWRISPGGDYRDGFSARVRLDETPGRTGYVLSVRLNGRPLATTVARQALALPPGSYRLSYRFAALELRGGSPLTWQVRCLTDRTTMIGSESTTVGDGVSQLIESRFTVPPACSAQELVLESSNKLAAAEGGRGTLMYDDIRISSSP